MNRNHAITFDDDGHTLIVDARPQSLRLPRGSAVFALAGQLWLTQDGRPEDTILAAGARHDLSGRGTVVVSAIGRGPAQLYVAPPAEAAAIDGTDLHGFLRRRAHALREQEVNRLWHALARRVGRVVTQLRARLRAQPLARRLARLRRMAAHDQGAPVPQGRHGRAA